MWIVIPALNAETTLPHLLKKIINSYRNVVVVDDGSTDGTRRVAHEYKAHVLPHPFNLGQGAALQTGFDYALSKNAQYVITMDADGQMDPADVSALLEPLRAERAEVTLGTRFGKKQVRNLPILRKWLLRAAILLTRLTTGLMITDTHNGFRGFRKVALESLNLHQNRMAHASEILEEIAQFGFRYEEVPVTIAYTSDSMRSGQRSLNAINILWELLFKGAKHRDNEKI